MITVEKYKSRLADKMVDKFLKELHEKTGMKATVMMDNMKTSKESDFRDGILSLDLLEESFLKAYPISFEINPLHNKGRKLEHVEARCIFCHIAREKLKFSYPGIGNYLSKDHSTIMHMTKRANNLLDTDDKFYNLYFKTLENIKTIYDKTIQYNN